MVSDLHNFSVPLIRYAIGDYAEVGGVCACGRGLPSIKAIRGRERNLLIKPDGTKHWPLLGFAQFNSVADIRQYQFIQHTINHLEFRIYANNPLNTQQKKQLVSIAQHALNYPFFIEIVEFNQPLPIGNNGKFEEFICLFASS